MIVSAGAGHELRRLAANLADGNADRSRYRRIFRCEGGHDDHTVADFVGQSGLGHQVDEFALHLFQLFFGKEATVEDRGAQIGHAGSLPLVESLTGENRIDIQRGVTRGRRCDGHLRQTRSQFGAQLFIDGLEEFGHLIHRVDAIERHAAVRDVAVHNQVEPPHAAMSEANTVGPMRLGNNHMLLARRIQIAVFGQVGHAGEASALFVYGGRLFDGSGQFDAGAAERFHRIQRGGDAGLHIGSAAAVEAALADLGAKRIFGPAGACGDDVEVSVEVNAGGSS